MNGNVDMLKNLMVYNIVANYITNMDTTHMKTREKLLRMSRKLPQTQTNSVKPYFRYKNKKLPNKQSRQALS